MIATSSDTPITSHHDAIEEAKKAEFKALLKIINDIGVELRLLASLAGMHELTTVDAQKMLDIYSKYEDASIDIIRKTTIRLRGK